MADPPPYPDTGVEPDRGSTAGIPRWVKVFGIIALVLVVLFAVLLLTGRGGNHGPGRHSSGGVGGHTPPASITADGEQQP